MAEESRRNMVSLSEEAAGGNSEIRIIDIENDRMSEEEEFHWDYEDVSVLDDDTLLQIKRADPSLSSIEVHDFDLTIDGEDVGHFIGLSPNLKKLLIKGESMLWEEDFKRTSFLLGRFCKGLALNRSVEHIMMRCCDLSVGDAGDNIAEDPRIKKLQQFTIMKMTQFCERNAKLQSLQIECCELGNKSSRVLAMVLSRKSEKSSLRRINLYGNEIDDDAAEELIDSLEGYNNLLELSLAYNHIGEKGCVALGKLLSDPTSRLRELNLGNNQIGDEGIAILAGAFAGSKALKEVDLGYNDEVTPAGWQQFFTCLENSSSSIETLTIGANRISDKEITNLGNALANNAVLKSLDFSTRVEQENPITADGWRSFFACLQNSKSALQEIHLRGCTVDEEGLAVVSDAVMGSSTMKILDLSNNPQVTTFAWRRFFADCLQSPKCPLEGLFLCENFGEGADEIMADLANSVTSDSKLEALDLGENPSITEDGWRHFSRALCNKSSIGSIYESNHVVSYFGPAWLPSDLNELIKLNEHDDKREVAREKILRHHFGDDTNVQELVSLKLKVLPHAISWLGRESSLSGNENAGHTPLYQLLRGLPSLFEAKNISGTKRKRCPESFEKEDRRRSCL